MAQKLFKGGFDYAEFSSAATFATVTELRPLLKAGTGITPESLKDEFSDGSVGMAAKIAKIAIRSADVQNGAGSAYALLKAAEEASTPQNFRFVGIQNEQVVQDCESAWNEQVVTGVTSSLDNADFKVGLGSAKLVMNDAEVVGVLASKAIASMNLTTRKGVSYWIKSSVATSAGDLQLLLDDTANCASPLETLNVPALQAGVWTKCYNPFATPANLTAVISVGLKMAVDKNAFTVNIDDVRAIADHVIVLNVIPQVEFEVNELGKFDALRVTGQAAGGAESDIIVFNV